MDFLSAIFAFEIRFFFENESSSFISRMVLCINNTGFIYIQCRLSKIKYSYALRFLLTLLCQIKEAYVLKQSKNKIFISLYFLSTFLSKIKKDDIHPMDNCRLRENCNMHANLTFRQRKVVGWSTSNENKHQSRKLWLDFYPNEKNCLLYASSF